MGVLGSRSPAGCAEVACDALGAGLGESDRRFMAPPLAMGVDERTAARAATTGDDPGLGGVEPWVTAARTELLLIGGGAATPVKYAVTDPVSVGIPSEREGGPLAHAAAEGRVDALAVLCHHGAMRSPEAYVHALAAAARHGRTDVVRWLASAEAAAARKDKRAPHAVGLAPLMAAVEPRGSEHEHAPPPVIRRRLADALADECRRVHVPLSRGDGGENTKGRDDVAGFKPVSSTKVWYAAARALVALGAEVGLKDARGWSALHRVTQTLTRLPRVLPRFSVGQVRTSGLTPYALSKLGVDDAFGLHPLAPRGEFVGGTGDRIDNPYAGDDALRLIAALIDVHRIHPRLAKRLPRCWLNEEDPEGFTPMERAIAADRADVAALLLTRPKAPDSTLDAPNLPPLTMPLSEEMLATLAAHASPESAASAANARGPDGRTPLTAAADRADRSAVRALVRMGARPTEADALGRYPLGVAAALVSRPNADLALLLLNAGAKAGDGVDAAKREGGATLIDSGGDVFSPNAITMRPGRWTPLALVVAVCTRPIGGQSTAGPRPSIDSDPRPRHVAAARMIAVLVERGADVDALDLEGWSPLLRSLAGDAPLLVRVLMKSGASLSTPGEPGGRTALEFVDQTCDRNVAGGLWRAVVTEAEARHAGAVRRSHVADDTRRLVQTVDSITITSSSGGRSDGPTKRVVAGGMPRRGSHPDCVIRSGGHPAPPSSLAVAPRMKVLDLAASERCGDGFVRAFAAAIAREYHASCHEIEEALATGGRELPEERVREDGKEGPRFDGYGYVAKEHTPELFFDSMHLPSMEACVVSNRVGGGGAYETLVGGRRGREKTTAARGGDAVDGGDERAHMIADVAGVGLAWRHLPPRSIPSNEPEAEAAARVERAEAERDAPVQAPAPTSPLTLANPVLTGARNPPNAHPFRLAHPPNTRWDSADAGYGVRVEPVDWSFDRDIHPKAPGDPGGGGGWAAAVVRASPRCFRKNPKLLRDGLVQWHRHPAAPLGHDFSELLPDHPVFPAQPC